MNKENNKGKKQLNGKLIKESLMDYNNLAQQLQENVADSVKSLLGEEVRQAYAAILNESDDEDVEEKEYDVEEVDDTQSDSTEEQSEGSVDDSQEDQDDQDSEGEMEDGMEADGQGDDTEAADAGEGDAENDQEAETEDEADFDFDQYKVSDNEYDFRNAKDDDIVKVFKRLKNDDKVTVVYDDNKVSISDNETGADYIIELSDTDEPSEIKDEILTDDDMNESRIYEIALNEYDSNVGYTDNYQKKDVMTTDGVKEPGKGRDIDDGVPHTTEKPWSKKKDAAPFNDKKGKTVECGNVTADNNAPEIAETAVQKGGTNRGMAKSHVPNTSCANNPKKHATTIAGEYQKNEAVIKKANEALAENKKLKAELDNLTDMLREAAVTNVNLGGIIKLISENSTSMEEKRNIINRFTNEVHTIEESKSLYKTISDELKKKPQADVNINEEKEFGSANAEVINESKFYQDEGLMSSLGLMHRICK